MRRRIRTAVSGGAVGRTPFALACVDREAGRVWLGRSAAKELCDRAGGDVGGDNYEGIADAVRSPTGAEATRATASLLTEDAAAALVDLADGCSHLSRSRDNG